MRYCGYCGASLNDDMLFCPQCGKKQAKIKEESNTQGQLSENMPSNNVELRDGKRMAKEKKEKTPIRIIVIILVLFCLGAGGYWGYNAYQEREQLNFNQELYYLGVNHYVSGEYNKAKECFDQMTMTISDDQGLYLLLSDAHTIGVLSENEVGLLANYLDFLDTKEVLLTTTNIATKFLDGEWVSADGETYLFFDKETQLVEFNLPHMNAEYYVALLHEIEKKYGMTTDEAYNYILENPDVSLSSPYFVDSGIVKYFDVNNGVFSIRDSYGLHTEDICTITIKGQGELKVVCSFDHSAFTLYR